VPFLRYPQLQMMKKLLVTLLFAGCSHVALAAPQTFEETLQSLTEESQRNDFTAALKDADKALNLAQTDEQKAKVFSRIGDIKFKQRDFVTAREQYERILELPKSDTSMRNNALVLIGTTYLLQQPNNYVKARETFQRIVDGNEFSAQEKIIARLQIASTYQRMGDNETARTQYQNIATDKSVELWARLSAFLSLAEVQMFQKNGAAARELRAGDSIEF